MTVTTTNVDQRKARMLFEKKVNLCAAAKSRPVSPRRYRAKRPGEVSTYLGAGILPVCRFNGQLYILVWQPQSGNKTPTVRWFDCGGKKVDAAELPSVCAVRKFAKQTYGVFGLSLDFEDPDVLQNMQHLYGQKCNMSLLLEGARRWARCQIMQHQEQPPTFYNILEQYHMTILPVPYVPAELIEEISSLVDDSKRCFMWLTPDEFKIEAMSCRVASMKGLHTALARLDMDDEFCEEGGYDAKGYHPAASSFSHQKTASTEKHSSDASSCPEEKE